MQSELDNYSQGFKERLQRYAELVVRHGLNVQPGQLVNISGEIIHRMLAGLIVQEAARAT